MGATPKVGQLSLEFASIDRFIRFQLVSQRVDAIGHTREARRKDVSRDAIPESRKTGVSATWMTCATLSTVSRPSISV